MLNVVLQKRIEMLIKMLIKGVFLALINLLSIYFY